MQGTNRTTKWLRWGGALATALVSVLAMPRPSAALDDTLEPNEVREVEAFTPEGQSEQPVDGHLRGYGFVANVTLVSRAGSVEDGFFTLTAPEGQRLQVFRVQYDIVDSPHDDLHPVRG